MQKITIIGYGKMAKAIAVGLNGKFELEIIGRNKEKIQRFIRENALKNASVVCAESTIDLNEKCIILAIKPYALDCFRYTGKARAIYSIMAGISIERLKECADAKHFIRVMPNIASLVGKGVSVIFVENTTNNPSLRDSATPNRGNLSKSVESSADSANQSDIINECKSIFAPLGSCIFVEKESYINPAGAISGSGTAYLGLVAEAMIDAGVREGLSLEVSKKLVRGLFSGFSALFTRIEAHTIRTDTTSPAGTTIEALAILENRGVRSAFMDAIHAANSKAKSIS